MSSGTERLHNRTRWTVLRALSTGFGAAALATIVGFTVACRNPEREQGTLTERNERSGLLQVVF